MVKTYWNTNPASVTTKRPNIQVKPRRGYKIINDLRVFLKRNATQMKVLKLRFYFGDVDTIKIHGESFFFFFHLEIFET